MGKWPTQDPSVIALNFELIERDMDSVRMSRQTAQLLGDFEALPDEQKRVFTVEFLRRVAPFDSGPLEDSEIADAAGQVLAGIE